MVFSRTGFQRMKLSKDPKFIDKLRDVVGLYVDPPAHAIVLSIKQKVANPSPIDRTQPGLPMKRGRAGTMTHDYKRHGTTTLFAASTYWKARSFADVAASAIVTRSSSASSMPLRRRCRLRPCHVILDNYAATSIRRCSRWLDRRPALRFPLHADLVLLAQCSRRVLRQTCQAATEAWRLPRRGQSSSRHQPLRRRDQP